MSDRRITPNTQKEAPPKLKTIAGLIQGLSYREMTEFAELVHRNIDSDDAGIIPEGLLKLSDEILNAKEGSSF